MTIVRKYTEAEIAELIRTTLCKGIEVAAVHFRVMWQEGSGGYIVTVEVEEKVVEPHKEHVWAVGADPTAVTKLDG